MVKLANDWEVLTPITDRVTTKPAIDVGVMIYAPAYQIVPSRHSVTVRLLTSSVETAERFGRVVEFVLSTTPDVNDESIVDAVQQAAISMGLPIASVCSYVPRTYALT